MKWKLEIEHPVVHLIDALPIPERAHRLDHVRPRHHLVDALDALVTPIPSLQRER